MRYTSQGGANVTILIRGVAALVKLDVTSWQIPFTDTCSILLFLIMLLQLPMN